MNYPAASSMKYQKSAYLFFGILPRPDISDFALISVALTNYWGNQFVWRTYIFAAVTPLLSLKHSDGTLSVSVRWIATLLSNNSIRVTSGYNGADIEASVIHHIVPVTMV